MSNNNHDEFCQHLKLRTLCFDCSYGKFSQEYNMLTPSRSTSLASDSIVQTWNLSQCNSSPVPSKSSGIYTDDERGSLCSTLSRDSLLVDTSDSDPDYVMVDQHGEKNTPFVDLSSLLVSNATDQAYVENSDGSTIADQHHQQPELEENTQYQEELANQPPSVSSFDQWSILPIIIGTVFLGNVFGCGLELGALTSTVILYCIKRHKNQVLKLLN